MKRSRCRPRRARRSRCGRSRSSCTKAASAATVDPVGGAYAIEEMTNRIEQRGRRAARSDSVDGRDAHGDRVRLCSAADSGLGLRRAAGARCRRGRDGGREPATWTTAPGTARVFQIDPDIERQQVERVRALRASRSESDWRAALAAVEQRRSRRRQPRAGDHHRGREARDARRGRRNVAAGVRRVSGDVAVSALLDVQHLTVTFGRERRRPGRRRRQLLDRAGRNAGPGR